MTAEKDFWSWFVQHEAELFNFEVDQENIFDQLAFQLGKVHKDLTFEFGPKTVPREFVVSAAGIKAAFPAVVSLVGAVPPLEKWQVTAFRPRRTLSNTVEFRGKRVDPEDVQFTLLNNGKMAGIYLFMPGFQENDTDLKQIGYLLLDEALGEYDVESRLGLIEMLPYDARTEGERYPLAELPRLFDQLTSRLEGLSGKPS